MYSSYQTVARNTLIYFLHKYFPDRDRLVTGRHPIDLGLDDPYYERIFTGENYVENYHILIQRIREFNENIPPLINSYMNLSPTMRVSTRWRTPISGAWRRQASCWRSRIYTSKNANATPAGTAGAPTCAHGGSPSRSGYGATSKQSSRSNRAAKPASPQPARNGTLRNGIARSLPASVSRLRMRYEITA